jgi:hypothetical protein
MSPLGLYPTGRTSPRNLLLDWRATDLSLNARTGQVGPLTRASTGTVIDANGVISPVANNVPRFGYSNGQFGLLLEGPRANSALGSCSFSNAAYWAGDTDYTITTAPSCIAGQVAYTHTNKNVAAFRTRIQYIGTFVNGQTDCFYVILENTDAVTTTIGIFDSTASAQVHLVDFTWSTKTVATTAGSGTKGVVALGNGRYLVWITATGTAAGTGQAGHTRTALCYVTGGAQNGFTTTLHHAQFELNAAFPSSVIVTTTVAVTRAADAFSLAVNAVPQAGTLYAKLVDLGTYATANARVAQLGSSPRLILYNPGQYQVYHDNGSTAVTSTAAAVPAFGNTLELRAALSSTGAVTLGQSVNAATEAVAAPSGANALAGSWPGLTLFINSDSSGGNNGSMLLQSLILARGNPSLAALQTLDLN